VGQQTGHGQLAYGQFAGRCKSRIDEFAENLKLDQNIQPQWPSLRASSRRVELNHAQNPWGDNGIDQQRQQQERFGFCQPRI